MLEIHLTIQIRTDKLLEKFIDCLYYTIPIHFNQLKSLYYFLLINASKTPQGKAFVHPQQGRRPLSFITVDRIKLDHPHLSRHSQAYHQAQ